MDTLYNINDKPQPEHRYRKRSCANCDRIDECVCFRNRVGKVPNYAAYGAICYSGLYSNEKPIRTAERTNEQRKEKYKQQKLKQQ